MPPQNLAQPSPTSDQRGFPIVGLPDIGAYEAGTPSNYQAWIWEILPATATAANHAGTFDFDQDGANNELEWLTLTDPANSSQALITGDGTIRNFLIPVGSAQSCFYRVVPAVP